MCKDSAEVDEYGQVAAGEGFFLVQTASDGGEKQREKVRATGQALRVRRAAVMTELRRAGEVRFARREKRREGREETRRRGEETREERGEIEGRACAWDADGRTARR